MLTAQECDAVRAEAENRPCKRRLHNEFFPVVEERKLELEMKLHRLMDDDEVAKFEKNLIRRWPGMRSTHVVFDTGTWRPCRDERGALRTLCQRCEIQYRNTPAPDPSLSKQRVHVRVEEITFEKMLMLQVMNS